MKNSIEKQCFDGMMPCFYYKIPDSYGNERFTPLKPFDAFFIVRQFIDASIPIALEYKMVKGKKAFPFSQVPEHQRAGLLKFSTVGSGFVVINYRFQGKDNKVNRAFCIDIEDFLRLEADMDRKSIPYSMFETEETPLFELERITGGWDIGNLLE